MNQSWINAIEGGAIIGFAAAMYLVLSGQILGVSGIIGRMFERPEGGVTWRAMFAAGCICGGAIGASLWPENFRTIQDSSDFLRLAIAGLIVGFGTKLGNGCTSGHGVCGIGRLSPRGIVATCVFITTGILTVLVVGR